ncbi:MAG: hypothetical protein M3Y34_09270 [Actinomycetota bacterium]|nr:hypothetical protein [Actinomycetota bacterium]
MKQARNTTIKAVIGSAVAAIALTGAGPAVAGGATDSKVTLKEVGSEFRGKVTSEKRTCERKRTVYVYRAQDGDDKLIGIDVTDSNGKYAVDFNLLVVNVKHYAIAFPKEATKATCKQATSKALFPVG